MLSVAASCVGSTSVLKVGLLAGVWRLTTRMTLVSFVAFCAVVAGKDVIVNLDISMRLGCARLQTTSTIHRHLMCSVPSIVFLFKNTREGRENERRR